MNRQVIIINGTGGSGKDTFIEFCSKYTAVKNFSSVDKVKEVAKLVGWDGGKTDKDRKFLSDLKRLTTEYNDMAFNSVKEAVKEFLQSNNELLFIHIREPEEIKRASEAFNALTLLVKREGLKNIDTNDSDKFVDDYPYDYIILNSTLEKLESDAFDFVKNVKERENLIRK